MSVHYFKSYEAIKSIKSAMKACSEALENASRPHLYGTALWDVNTALRHLTQAQFRLMQAKREFSLKDGLDKN